MAVQYNLEFLRNKTLERTKYFCSVDYCVERTLNVACYSDAYIDPANGVWDSMGNFCRESYKHYFPGIETVGRREFSHDEEGIEIRDETVLYIGMFMSSWGHYLTDNIKHLWPIISSDAENLKFRNIPMVYITEQGGAPDNFFRMMDLLGVERSRLRRIDRLSRFRSIYVPDQCFFYDLNNGYERHCTREYYGLVREISGKVEPKYKYDKIFFTTSSFSQRAGNYGLAKLDKAFRKLGYEVISPEKLDFVEMVSLLKGCRVFASTEGSAGHNSLFLKEGTECIFLRRVDAVNVYQHFINYVRSLDVTLVDAHLSFLLYYRPMPWNGPFFLYWSKQMRKWSGVWHPFPVGEFTRYVWDYGQKWVRSKLQGVKHAI